MTRIASLAATAALIGDPARAAIVLALMDGRAFTARELATVAGVTAQTASVHFAKLVDGRLLTVVAQGRHRYFRLASPAVAEMVEGMMGLAGAIEEARARRPLAVGPRDRALRHARVCYDHLAGEVAVALTDALVKAGAVTLSDDGAALTPIGRAMVTDFGIALADGHDAHSFCRPCLDWSERRPHLAGHVGRSLLREMIGRDWLRRGDGRVIDITPAGRSGFKRAFALDVG